MQIAFDAFIENFSIYSRKVDCVFIFLTKFLLQLHCFVMDGSNEALVRNRERAIATTHQSQITRN